MEQKPDLVENNQEQLTPYLIEATIDNVLPYKDSYLQGLKDVAQLAKREISEEELENKWNEIHTQKWKEMMWKDTEYPSKMQEFWCISGDKYLGKVQYKRYLTEKDKIKQGNIGYEVVPSARRKGVASFMLSKMIEKSKIDGLQEVMIGCDSDNFGSIGVIEKAGGEMVRNHIDIDGVFSNIYLVKL